MNTRANEALPRGLSWDRADGIKIRTTGRYAGKTLVVTRLVNAAPRLLAFDGMEASIAELASRKWRVIARGWCDAGRFQDFPEFDTIEECWLHAQMCGVRVE